MCAVYVLSGWQAGFQALPHKKAPLSSLAFGRRDGKYPLWLQKDQLTFPSVQCLLLFDCSWAPVAFLPCIRLSPWRKYSLALPVCLPRHPQGEQSDLTAPQDSAFGRGKEGRNAKRATPTTNTVDRALQKTATGASRARSGAPRAVVKSSSSMAAVAVAVEEERAATNNDRWLKLNPLLLHHAPSTPISHVKRGMRRQRRRERVRRARRTRTTACCI